VTLGETEGEGDTTGGQSASVPCSLPTAYRTAKLCVCASAKAYGNAPLNPGGSAFTLTLMGFCPVWSVSSTPG